MTDPITAALNRLQEYAAAHPEHDTDELVAKASAALAEPVAERPAVAERPSVDELGLIYHDCCRGCEFMDQVGFEDAALVVLARWGRPTPPAPPAEGEVAELVNYLRGIKSLHCQRAAELLERLSPVPVPVVERLPGPKDCAPWPGDPNPSHWCWVGRDVDGGWEWEQRSADCLLVFDEDWWTHWLPAHALPLPAPQGGEVEPADE